MTGKVVSTFALSEPGVGESPVGEGLSKITPEFWPEMK